MKTITFYSYKGGVGRSQLCANIASYLFHKKNKRVLLWDWDLEAPGLDYYAAELSSQFAIGKKEGTIDLMLWYCKKIIEKRDRGEALETSQFRFNEEKYIVELKKKNSATLDILPAGKFDGYYSDRVSDFNWEYFYESLNGWKFLDYIKNELQKRRKYDYILIDSRTGRADYAGICNIHLPDYNVVVMAANHQNITESKKIICKVLEERNDNKIFPVLSRINSNHKDFQLWSKEFSNQFNELLSDLDPNLNKSFQEQIFRDFYLDKTLLEDTSQLSAGENILINSQDTYLPRSSFARQYANIGDYIVDLDKEGSIEIESQVDDEAWEWYATQEKSTDEKRAYAYYKADKLEKSLEFGGTSDAYIKLGDFALRRESSKAQSFYFKAITLAASDNDRSHVQSKVANQYSKIKGDEEDKSSSTPSQMSRTQEADYSDFEIRNRIHFKEAIQNDRKDLILLGEALNLHHKINEKDYEVADQIVIRCFTYDSVDSLGDIFMDDSYGKEFNSVSNKKILKKLNDELEKANKKYSLIHYAALFGNLSLFKSIQEYGEDIWVAGIDGSTALYLASLGGKLDIIKHILDPIDTATEKVELINKKIGEKKLNSIRANFIWGHQNIIDYFLGLSKRSKNQKIDLVSTDYRGWTLTHIAVFELDIISLKMLIGKKVDLDAKLLKSKLTPFLVAVSEGYELPMQLLYETGKIDVHAKTSSQWSALHLAARNGNSTFVKRLLEMGLDPVDQTDSDQIALFLGIVSENIDTIRTLILRTPNWESYTDNKGLSAFEIVVDRRIHVLQSFIDDLNDSQIEYFKEIFNPEWVDKYQIAQDNLLLLIKMGIAKSSFSDANLEVDTLEALKIHDKEQWEIEPILSKKWTNPSPTAGVKLLKKLKNRLFKGNSLKLFFNEIRRIRTAKLSCYSGSSLIEICTYSDEEFAGSILLIYDQSENRILLFNGTSPPIHKWNATSGLLKLKTEEQVKEYVELFCHVVHGEEGAFSILNTQNKFYGDFSEGDNNKVKDIITGKMEFERKGEDWETKKPIPIKYSNAVFKAGFRINSKTGMVDMLDDTPVLALKGTYQETFKHGLRQLKLSKELDEIKSEQ